MNFIFFGRLAKEKGFDLIVQALLSIVDKTGELPGNICIFGEGDLREHLFRSFADSPFFEDYSQSLSDGDSIEESLGEGKKIYFFGWQSQENIRNILQISHFSLMPSRFLETFGLSALESLSEGVPVIGFQKGGLIPFISEEGALPFARSDEENSKVLADKMIEVSEKYSVINTLEWKILSNQSRLIADSYTEGRWMEQVREFLPKETKRILLVSDYTTILGGIESHVQTIAKSLRSHGYEVEVFGWAIQKGHWTKFLRIMGLVYSLCNITSMLAIRKKIREYAPDAVWFHSVSRFQGPLVVGVVAQSGVFSLVTYHDLGLWSPFPSRIQSEDMIPKTKSLGSFLSVIHSGNPLTYIAAYGKYFQVCILRNLLKKIHIHIVPSAFLAPYVERIGGVSREKIVVLEHFL